ncbi:MAG TPA: amidohydrolase family protein [Rubrobacteraceae bacterium]|nr:amidohydrolase family protein [Rubrobacteraceae bacterium]
MRHTSHKRAVYLLVVLYVTFLGACEPNDQAGGPRADGASTSSANSFGSGRTRAYTTSATVDSTENTQKTIEADLLLTGGTLVDGTGKLPLRDSAVAVKDGKILGVVKAGALDISEVSRTLDVSGKTILPGFINTHVHSRYVTLEQTKAWTREGVTTVRDLSGPLDAMVGRKRDSEAGDDPQLPRLLVSGPMISVPGGHPFPIYGDDYPALAVRGPNDARDQVNRLLDAGVDHIKIAVSGRVDTGWPELSDEEIRAITSTAHARGARVAAHIDTAAGLRRAVENGVDDAAHSPRDHIPEDLIDEMVERDVALSPTIDVYENLAEEGGTIAEWNAETLPVMQDNLRRFARAGGTLALGDDFGNPGVELGMPMDEMQQWILAGLSPMQVIVAATRDAAKVSSLGSEIGTVEKGKAADLLVVNGDPLSDLRSLERVELVVHDGELAFSR